MQPKVISVKELPISNELKNKITISIANYKRAGIDIEIIDKKTIRIKQSTLINGYILNNKQLYERAKDVFYGYDVHIIPAVYSLSVDEITVEWIEGKMQEFGINRNDLIKQLALDKASLSLYFSRQRELTQTIKAAFFLFFSYIRIKQRIKRQLNFFRSYITDDNKIKKKNSFLKIIPTVEEHLSVLQVFVRKKFPSFQIAYR
jgi:hypothetical protein